MISNDNSKYFSLRHFIAFFQQSKIFRMHELLYVYNKCLSGIGAIYFWYSTYLNIILNFLIYKFID